MKLRRRKNEKMNKILILFGSSGSLGKELIKHFLKNDYTIYAIYNEHKIKTRNKNIIKYKYDLLHELNFEELINSLSTTINKKSEVSIIYTSGIYYKINIEDFTEEELLTNLKINVIGFINFFKKSINLLKKANLTNVILIGTNLLHRKNKGSLYYVLSKGMQTQLIKQLAYEYGEFNILFNQISPGMFISNMNKSTTKNKIKMISQNIPIRRLCTKEEISKFIYNFINNNTLITGEEIIIDGGNTIGY